MKCPCCLAFYIHSILMVWCFICKYYLLCSALHAKCPFYLGCLCKVPLLCSALYAKCPIYVVPCMQSANVFESRAGFLIFDLNYVLASEQTNTYIQIKRTRSNGDNLYWGFCVAETLETQSTREYYCANCFHPTTNPSIGR